MYHNCSNGQKLLCGCFSDCSMDSSTQMAKLLKHSFDKQKLFLIFYLYGLFSVSELSAYYLSLLLH